MSEELSKEIPIYFCDGPWTMVRVLEKARQEFPGISDDELMKRMVLVPTPVVWLKLKPS